MRKNHRHMCLVCSAGESPARLRATEPGPPNFLEESPMPEIAGGLLADLHPKRTVRIVFIAHTGAPTVA